MAMMSYMNKEDMVSALALKTGFTKKDSEVMLEAVFGILLETLVSGDKVHITGFGTFDVKERAPRIGRNPKANVPVHIPAKRVPVFKPGKILKSSVEDRGLLKSHVGEYVRSLYGNTDMKNT